VSHLATTSVPAADSGHVGRSYLTSHHGGIPPAVWWNRVLGVAAATITSRLAATPDGFLPVLTGDSFLVLLPDRFDSRVARRRSLSARFISGHAT